MRASWSVARQTILNVLIGLLPVVATSNLFLVLCLSCGYVVGLRSDYLLPRLYAVDLIVLAIVGWGIWQQVWAWPKKVDFTAQKAAFGRTAGKIGLLVLLGLLGLRQLWAAAPLVASWTFLQYGLIAAAGYTLVKAWKLVNSQALVTGLMAGLVLQTLVAGYQAVYQRPLFEYHILGETNLQRVVGITTRDFGTVSVIAPYGTTAHPNILAGFIAVYSVLIIRWLMFSETSKKNQSFTKMAITLVVISSWAVLWFTQSTSGAAILVTGGLWLAGEEWLRRNSNVVKQTRWLRWVVISAIIVLFASSFLSFALPGKTTSIMRRQYLLQTSWAMLQQHWLFGSGLSNFTALGEQFSPTREVVRFNQPVHHVGWLWAAETGLLGLVVVCTLFWSFRGNLQALTALAGVLVIALPALVWDHYLLSIESGRVLIGIIFMGMISNDHL